MFPPLKLLRGFPLSLLLPGLLWGGCRTAPSPVAPPPAGVGVASSTRVVTNTPAQLHRFTLCQKMNPVWWLGNADRPAAPDNYRPGERGRDFRWHLRNPCHNFTFYVMGIADEPFTRTGRFPERNFNPGGGWNWAVCRYGWVRLPFVSYQRGRFKFYCGWRSGGNFGMEFKPAEKPPPPKPDVP